MPPVNPAKPVPVPSTSVKPAVTAAPVIASSVTRPGVKVPSVPLMVAVQALTDDTLAHPTVRDKSPDGVASRVARHLNSLGYAPPEGQPYWNAARVKALFGVQAAPIARGSYMAAIVAKAGAASK